MRDKLHPVLRRQLKRLKLNSDISPESDEAWQEFLARVEKAYRQADEDRYTLERSLRVSSDEMNHLYKTLKRNSESELQIQRDRLSSVISSIKEGLFVLNMDNEIISLNNAGSKMLGYSEEELVGKNLFDTIEVPNSQRQLFSSSEELSKKAFESKFIRANGDEFLVQFSLAPLKSHDEEGFVLTFRDITHQKSFENALKEAKDQAIQASKMKSEFLATMSHEIRTPINGILSLAQLLLYSELTDEQHEDVVTLAGCAETLREMISNILDLSKIEAGKLVIEAQEYDVRKVIRRVKKELQSQLEDKCLEYLFLVNEDVPDCIIGDSFRLQQVIMNLISNSIKFTEVGGAVIVRVSLNSNSSSEDQRLTISVADSGIGIPKEKQKVIFDTFTQADGSTTRQYGGTGLGLSICSSLLQLMGGEIKLRSKERMGTVFTLEIPVIEGKSKKAKCDSLVIQNNPKGGNNSLHILLVEDNEVNQNSIGRILRANGYKVRIAGDGVEAIEQLNCEQFDLVLMDLHMPRMDGLEATQAIRTNSSNYSSIPIVALTAHAVSGVKESCIEAGMQAYITKPIDYKKLFNIITRVTPS